jgi:hypothetical protein
MLTEYQAQQLQREMHREMGSGLVMVWKCALGLAIVVALTLIAAPFDTQHDVNTDGRIAMEQALE